MGETVVERSWICTRCSGRRDGPGRCPDDGWRLVPDLTGQLIAGRYLIADFLGAGGGGATVWRASEIGRGAPLALKLLGKVDDTSARRFERGARLAMTLDHPSIAAVHEFGEVGDTRYVAMELLDGESLQERLGKTGRLGLSEAVTLVSQVLDALAVAHAAGIVHRDLKPGNLVLARDPSGGPTTRAKLLDFGIARATEHALERLAPMVDEDEGFILGDEITARHHICGTPEYMAPEQILGGAPAPSMDIYAVGVVLYRLLTGAMPFSGKSRFELYHCHLTTRPAPFDPALELPAPLETLVLSALSKRPEERPATALTFRDALLDAVGLEPASPQEPAPTTPLPAPLPADDGRTLEDDGGAAVAYGPNPEQRFQALIMAPAPDPTPDPAPGVEAHAPPGSDSAPPLRSPGTNTGRRRLGVAIGLVAGIVALTVTVLVALG
jgi:serine/threonine protein kinase